MTEAATGAISRKLYVFPISHYCEKARWLLDAKGLAYETINLLPGLHRSVAAKHGAPGTVPLYVERDAATGRERVFGDSTDLALYLERTEPASPLLPTAERERAEVLAWESRFDDEIGPEVRRWVYGPLTRDHAALRGVFFAGYSARVRAWSPLLALALSAIVSRAYRVNPTTVKRARVRIEAGLQHIEAAISGDPSRYLVGDRFTLADLTAASMIAPLVRPKGSPWAHDGRVPAEMEALRDDLLARPVGKWVTERYRCDRNRGSSS